MAIFEVEAGGRLFDVEAPDMASAAAALRSAFGGPAPNKGSVQAIGPEDTNAPSLLTRARDLVTGELRTEFPDAPEFGKSLSDAAAAAGRGTPAPLQMIGSLVTPDPEAQLEILRRGITGLEDRRDVFGNIMLRAPAHGVSDWTYLNKPGLSARDVGEVLVPTVATAPLSPVFGAGRTVAARVASGAGVGAGTSVAQDVAATALGSEQGIDPERAALSAVLGGALGPVGPRRPAAAPERAPAAGTAADDVVPQPQPAPAGGLPGSPAAQTAPELRLPGVDATPPAPAGAPQIGVPMQVVTPDGQITVTATPEIVELSDLRLARGPLQPRDRTGRSEYTLGARERAQQLDPERLLPGRVSDTGAPIVLDDGTVISGNGRIMSINEVYASPALGERAAAYRARLGPAAQGMQRPVLVMRLGPMGQQEAARFADLSNRPAVAAMSVTERAARDARALGDDALALYQGGDFEAPQNFDFLRAFMERAVTPAERASVSQNARLTREGADRMRAAILHAAYEDSSLISRMLESTDDNVRSLTNALVDAAPRMTQLRADIRAGLVPAELDAAEMIGEAVRLIGDLRRRGITPQRHFAQADAFPTTNPMAEQWVRALYTDDLSRPLSRERAAAVLNAYADEARLHQRGGLFPDDTTDAQVLAAARARVAREHGADVPSPAPAATPSPAPAPTGTSGAGMQGGREAFDNAAAESLGPRELPRQPRGPMRDPMTAGLTDELRQAPQRPTQPQIAEASELLQQRFGDEAPGPGMSAGQVPRAVGGGLMTQRAAAGLSATFIGAPLAEAARQALEGLGRISDRIIRSVGSGGHYSPGEAARGALGAWIAGHSQDIERELYDRVGSLLLGAARDRTRPLVETRQLVAVLQNEQQRSTTKVHQLAIDMVKEALERPEGLTYDGLKNLRTAVRAKIDDKLLPEGGTVKPGLERVHAALTRDLRATVHRFGRDEAVDAFDAATATAREFALRRKSLSKVIGDAGDVNAERVMARIVDMAGSGASGDLARLTQIKSVVGADGWDEVVSGVLARIMMNPDGTFSPAQFVRRYGRLSANGKNAVFGGELRESLDALATVSSQFDQLNRLGNPSGTGNVFAMFGGGFLLSSNPLTVLATFGGGALLARLLARPLTAKATVQFAKVHLQAARQPSPATALLLQQAARLLADALTRDEEARDG